ncbi:MAG: Hpt domain-containing protein [Acidobacteriota bacterium]
MPAEIDLKTFNYLKATAGDDFVGELIDTFFGEAVGTFAALHASLGANNAEVFRRAAHSLKSSANTFGALRLGKMASELEQFGRSNTLAAVGDALALTEAEYGDVQTALRRLRGGA